MIWKKMSILVLFHKKLTFSGPKLGLCLRSLIYFFLFKMLLWWDSSLPFTMWWRWLTYWRTFIGEILYLLNFFTTLIASYWSLADSWFLYNGPLFWLHFVFLKGQCHEISTSGFFHESVTPKHLSILLRPFRIFSKIRGDIRGSRCTAGVNDTGGKWKKSSSRKILIILFGHLRVVELTYI